uniref:Uncharacterized protein CG13380 n=2 Tax=Drosophila melanogaster TaxID=7227 RepID=Y3380_DROME|nr:uncharacterized protein Dmel_CG13380, isoform B [Drosophila melanogaster]NP_001262016.1 uncharacterized protein Dmel_CG13380, isoform C [Drosophila melanogaster]NP_001287105.1 uncharacterized protein Dmel_CG13380, isoform D [Drosophila melanogaster]Q9VVR0.2 RecName: Full=Uncharacterized protein CG13380 [Drosophila melanogaster]AAF49250.2 uncharacterized protein Dmel_CG13380, isoform B [Drosophila melanogaster]AGB94709.1 uncharacterized protein Dmel_CG13380, isoform C [Drosophila melanogaste|eukprot:NP_001034030.1 uncharacterized protein Dmel_CG13380, isoform B [Drosophila melanogaster]
MPFANEGNDPIAARLSKCYWNLSSPFLKDVIPKKRPSKAFNRKPPTKLESEEEEYHKFERGLHISDLGPKLKETDGQPKLKFELADDYKSSKHCICMRSNTAYECERCHQYFYGRLAQICDLHPNEFFLMDFRNCPFCKAPIEMIKKSPISWETIRKIEEAELPSDGDL